MIGKIEKASLCAGAGALSFNEFQRKLPHCHDDYVIES